MSDYFAALMRASGLTQSPVAPTPAEADLSVIDLQIPAAATPGVTQETPVRERIESPRPAAVAKPTTTLAATPTPPRHVVDASPQPPVAVESSADSAPTTTVTAPATPPLAASDEPVLAQQALVQSVLRWVAADPQLPPEQRAAERFASTTLPPLPEVKNNAAATIQASPAPSPTATNLQALAPVQPAAHQDTPQQATLIQTVPTISEPGQPQPALAAWRDDSPSEVQPAQQSQELSISIGAIHLRVEAPPAASPVQASARPAAPVAPRASSSAPVNPSRGSLSRRALRRI